MPREKGITFRTAHSISLVTAAIKMKKIIHRVLISIKKIRPPNIKFVRKDDDVNPFSGC